MLAATATDLGMLLTCLIKLITLTKLANNLTLLNNNLCDAIFLVKNLAEPFLTSYLQGNL